MKRKFKLVGGLYEVLRIGRTYEEDFLGEGCLYTVAELVKTHPEDWEQVQEDSKIGDKQTDEHGEYRIVNGDKIYQIEEKTPEDKKLNEVINRVRASGRSPWEYLNNNL